MKLPEKLKWLQVSSLWVYRVLTWSVLAAGFLFAAAVLGMRYWVLPNIESYREDIARIVSEKARQKIAIGRIRANWDGLRPQLVLEKVTVFDRAGRPALELSRVDHTLSWLSLPTMELRFYSLDIYQPTLNIRRDSRGALSVAGMELTGEEDGGGFADWLLRQRDIEVHNAIIVWNDELRAAPRLELKSVNLHIFNRGDRHRFGLRAVPPKTLAAPLDMRGDFTGETIRALADWNGKLFMQLDYADIAAWRAWVPFPIEFPRGAGALRAWLNFSHHQLTDIVADVRLAGVRTRLAKDLPMLDLADLAGRIGWKQSDSSFEVTTSRLGLMTTGGLILQPADFLLRVVNAGERRPGRGELNANALDLAPLVTLADHLPIPAEARKQLAALAPKGSLYDVVVRWTGEWREPSQYSAKGRFNNLALNRMGKIPGFNGVSGSLEGNERGGTLYLNTNRAAVDMPLVFRQPLEFDVLTAQIAWLRSGGEHEVRLNSISFSNPHLAGTVFGNYRTAGDTRGSIDLTGNLTRAEGRFVSRYIPLVVGEGVRTWLDAAFLEGGSNDVTLRLRGNLDEFPFPDSKNGLFQVTAKVTGGTLDYARGWPQIENISGDLVFRGRRMDVNARQGTILGAHLAKVHAEIPDLTQDVTLDVNGEAEGATSEFFTFIEKSPVLGMIDHFTEGMKAQGQGKLTLKLVIPLRATDKSRINGTYLFANNTITSDPDLPAVEQAAGRVEFTESSVRTQNLAGTVLGGPVTISAVTQRDSTVRVSVQGRVNADNVRRAGSGPSWAQHLRGMTDWRAAYTIRKKIADVVVESSLQGIAVDLPAPLVKTAAEVLPFRFERRTLAPGQDRLSLAFGDIVSANLVRRHEGGRHSITRGTVRFGGQAAEPERNGVWVSGAAKALDLDRWLAFFRQAGSGDAAIEWGGMDLKLGAMDALGRRFNDLGVQAATQGGQWRGTVSSKELDGSIVWQPQGRGKLTARMKTLSIPPAAPAVAQPTPVAGVAQAPKEVELPALDIVVDQFVRNDRQVGRLELIGTPEGRDWRIDKLRIVNPEGNLAVEGLWQNTLAQPRTQVALRLEASEAGKLLTRFGHPEGVRRGTAKLEGVLSWNGAPYDFDYPTLSGSLLLEAAKGQFLKLEPGIGKLLGILSLQALPRRVTLDFRDIFSEGFAFDEIVGAIKIARGIAATEALRIQGPSGRVVMSGEVDLAQETQKLRVRISPHISDGVSIAGALVGGPIAGVAAFIAQKVLKDPLDQLASYEYSVTGTWSEPNVARAERQAGAPESSKSQ